MPEGMLSLSRPRAATPSVSSMPPLLALRGLVALRLGAEKCEGLWADADVAAVEGMSDDRQLKPAASDSVTWR